MDYIKPSELIADSLQAAEKKACLPVRDLLIRGFLAGSFLGYATSLTIIIRAQGLPPFVGAAVFPVGFVLLVLLGLELATGNFALLPKGIADGRVKWSQLWRNWCWVYLANLIGSVFYGILFFLSITSFGTEDGGTSAELVRQIAEKKTLSYEAIGANGWGTAVVKAILANWMVTVGTMMAFVSRSTIGKIAAMWLPITIFFAHGYEHSIVNMFLIPTGILFGSPISISEWWWWNQIPVTLGNIFGGAVFTGIALLFTYKPTS